MHFRILFFVVIVAVNHCSGMELFSKQPENNVTTSKGCIIILNGTTTSGKSSIALELAKKLEIGKRLRVDILALDTFFIPKVQWALGINRINPLNIFVANADIITSQEIKAISEKSHEELCEAAKTAYNQGKIVIIDTPAYHLDQSTFYHQALADCNVIWALVYCPISTLVDRVIGRNAEANIIEQRSILQALDQFSHLYRSLPIYSIDMLSRDTVIATCDKAETQHGIMQKTIPDFLKGVQKAICPSNLDDIKKSLLEAITHDGNQPTNISTVISYDCVVNTELNDPAICAQKIFEVFKK